MGASTASSQRQGYCRKRISGSRSQSGRETGNRKKKTTTGMAASGTHQRRETADFATGNVPRRQLITIAGDGHGDHGDGDPRNLAQNDVVQREQWVGVAREEPVVLEVVAGIFGGLLDVDPIALEGRREPVDGGEAETQHAGERGTKQRRPGFVDQSPEQRDAGHEIAGHYAQGKVREPRASEREGERRGGTVENAEEDAGFVVIGRRSQFPTLSQKARKDGARGWVAVAHRQTE